MKIRTIKYFIKEGILNIWSNKWMSIASASVVFIVLFIIGVVFLVMVNVKTISGKVEDLHPMSVIIVDNADKETAQKVKSKIEKIDGVKKVIFIDKPQGLQELKKMLGNSKGVIDGIESDFLPYKLTVYLDDISKDDVVKASIEDIKEVREVKYPKETKEKVLKVIKIVINVLILLFIGLGAAALFIIMYTIKLTVFARRREINIMKYVGATDWFVRWPFVIEGIIIGLLGALISVLLLFVSYERVVNLVATTGIPFIQLVPLDAVLKKEIFWIFIVLGSGIGALGSIISVKKYLYV